MERLIAALMDHERDADPANPAELHETHISWVIVAGDHALKIKKPVDFGFVNFTTLELRRHFCEEEVRLNRRLAPDLYLGIVSIKGPVESLRMEQGVHDDAIEYAVKMRRFPQSSLLANVLARSELLPRHLDDLSLTLARFHAAAEIATSGDLSSTADQVIAPARANLDAIATVDSEVHFAGVPESAKAPRTVGPPVNGLTVSDSLKTLSEWTTSESGRLREVFRERMVAGRVRDCHGDLHLGNMLLENDRITIFDCLEFNPDLRWLDVMSEVAFLTMDLIEREQPGFAWRVLNGWLEQTNDYAGLIAWRWYFVYRALVRAKVAALRLTQPDVESDARQSAIADVTRYVQAAMSAVRPGQHGIILTRGLSGSGKSFLAERLLEVFGAIRIRSDVERKRLFALWGEPRCATLSGDIYDRAVNDRLYRETLPQTVRHILASQLTAIVDATFLRVTDRSLFRELAAQMGVPFAILDVSVPAEVARSRITARQQQSHDPSDADIAVYERQRRDEEPLGASESAHVIEVDGTNPNVDEVIQELRRRGFEPPLRSA